MMENLWIKLYLLLLVGIGAITAAGYCFKLSWNLTPSLPLGIWSQIGAVDLENLRGKVVSFCPPNTPLFLDARARGILKWGRCPFGFAPLLKRVVGVPGDVVEVDEWVKVNGAIVDHSSLIKEVATFYSAKPLLKKLSSREIWVMGDTENSFDSRYFGAYQIKGAIPVQQPAY